MIKLIQLGIASLLIIFLFNLFTPSGIWLNFKMNQSFIAKNLCVKKEIKENTCKGKCHLKKELEKVQTQENHQDKEPSFPINTLDHLFNQTIDTYNFLSVRTIHVHHAKTFGILKGYAQISNPPPQV